MRSKDGKIARSDIFDFSSVHNVTFFAVLHPVKEVIY
jgi:hypothetical protein